MTDDASNLGGPGAGTVEALVEGLRSRDRAALARAITLVESTAPRRAMLGQEIVRRILPETGRSRRLGITGVPGVGKSTFIEALGMRLCAAGHRVAVLAIDPTSALSGGSILGDRTRMERLSREANAFIRPTPSGGSLGGVGRRTREAVLLCESAGFDVVLVETVGVGQSEIVLRSLVDFFLLLLLPGAGDDLQGIKRGVMEMADAVLINKADGENAARAEAMRMEQTMALQHLMPITPGWQTQVGLCSARTGAGVEAFLGVFDAFFAALSPADGIATRRKEQAREWFLELVREEVVGRFFDRPAVQGARPALERSVVEGTRTPAQAVRELLELGEAPAKPADERAPERAG